MLEPTGHAIKTFAFSHRTINALANINCAIDTKLDVHKPPKRTFQMSSEKKNTRNYPRPTCNYTSIIVNKCMRPQNVCVCVRA